MKWWFSRSVLLLSLAAGGCASPVESAKPDATLAANVLTSVPADVQNRTLVDFGGAVHLVGWDLEPSARAAPGSKLKLKLYWRSVKRLTPGWGLFTHLIVPGQDKPFAFDGVGLLRSKLSPSDWVPGMIYVDEQDLTVPELSSAEVTLAVGLHRQAVQVEGKEVDGLTGLRLPILSGLSDGRDRAIVARLATGVDPNQKKLKERRAKPADRRGADRPARGPKDAPRAGARPEPMDAKETP
jgi:hypothetical protein